MFKGLALSYIMNSITHRVTPLLGSNHVISLCGFEWDLSAELLQTLQEYVSTPYNSKAKEVNNARAELFRKKFTSEKKAIDLSALPPCFSVFKLHCERANMVAAIWRRCGNVIVDQPNINSHAGVKMEILCRLKTFFPTI